MVVKRNWLRGLTWGQPPRIGSKHALH